MSTSMQFIKDRTLSYCDVCYNEVPARVYENGGDVRMQKTCPVHGEFSHVIEKDPDYYMRFAHLKMRQPGSFGTMVVPVTFRCNLNCTYCYAPHSCRPDMSLNEIESAIKANPAVKDIAISGGEPTLRDDLFDIIKIAKAAGRGAVLLTNGLRLSDRKYVSRLKKAGLDMIFFSLDSFSPDFYRTFKGTKSDPVDLVGLKLKAMDNIGSEGISTFLSATIYPGSNDKEIGDLFSYSFDRTSYIDMLRLRSCVAIGRNDPKNNEGYFGSELFNAFASSVNIPKETLLKTHLANDDHSPYHVLLNMNGGKRFQVRIIHWPNAGTVDLLEVDRGVGHITKENRVINFCRAIILDNRENGHAV